MKLAFTSRSLARLSPFISQSQMFSPLHSSSLLHLQSPANQFNFVHAMRIRRTMSTTTSTSSKKEVSTNKQKYSFGFLDIVLGGSMGLLIVYTINLLCDWPPVCEQVVEHAGRHSITQAIVGEPMKASFFWSGTVENDFAKVVIPISGPNGKGTIYGTCIRQEIDNAPGPWQILEIQALFPEHSNKRLDVKTEDSHYQQDPSGRCCSAPRLAGWRARNLVIKYFKKNELFGEFMERAQDSDEWDVPRHVLHFEWKAEIKWREYQKKSPEEKKKDLALLREEGPGSVSIPQSR